LEGRRTAELENRNNYAPAVTGWIEQPASAAADALQTVRSSQAHRRHGHAGRGEWINRVSYKSHRPGAMIFR